MDPAEGDVNNIIPQMAAEYLPAVLLAVFFVMIIGALSSTADSDLAAMSSIVMADVYGQGVAGGKDKADPRRMLLIGRLTMVAATALAVLFAGLRLNILDLLVFVGALWGALVFPVIASFYWNKVTNRAFTTSVLAALACFLPVRFDLLPDFMVIGLAVDVLAILGVGIVLGLMTFGFVGLRPALVVGVIAIVAAAPFALGALHDYATLSGSLVAYAVSTIVCWAMSARSSQDFDFAEINRTVGDFDVETESLTETVRDTPTSGRNA